MHDAMGESKEMKQKRIEKLQKKLQKEEVDFLYLEDEKSIFYLTGLVVEQAQMYIGLNSSHLFVDGRFLEYAQKETPDLPLSLLSEGAIEDFLKKEVGSKQALFLFPESYSVGRLKKLRAFLSERKLGDLFIGENPIDLLRMVKDPSEIQAIKKACSLTWTLFEELSRFFQEGVSEKEAATHLEILLRQKGASEASFPPIIAYTENAAYPHHIPSGRRCSSNELILIDMGVVLDHYRSDMTRVIFYGEIDPKLQEIYDVVRRAQDKAISLCKPGVRLGELDKAARRVIEEAGFGNYFTHSLGHGIGLETHENPRVKEGGRDSELLLSPGMVITIEPGIYIPGLGGVRYEDIIVITQESCENLYS